MKCVQGQWACSVSEEKEYAMYQGILDMQCVRR